MTNSTQQRVFSVARQVLAIISVAMGVITASVNTLHLPAAVSAVLVVAGGVILAVEHFVADPSTGTLTTTTTVATKPTTTTVQVAPQPVPTLAGNAGAPTTVPVVAAPAPTTIPVVPVAPPPPA